MMTKTNIGAVAAFGLLAAFGLSDVACSSTKPDFTTPVEDTQNQNQTARVTDFELQDQLRSVWAEQATLTHVWLVEDLAGLPEAAWTFDRLLHNHEQIGNALAPFINAARGETLAALLRDRALIAGDVANAPNVNARDAAIKRLLDNADRIAELVLSTDPRIPLDVTSLVRLQANAILDEIAARTDRKWADAVTAQKAFMLHTTAFADILAWSIANRYPAMIAPSDLDPASAQLERDAHTLWNEYAFWKRAVIVETSAGLPSAYMALNQLMYNHAAAGDAVKPYYGQVEGSRLTLLLATYAIATNDAIITGNGNDAAAKTAANARMHANADAIAALYGAANPGMLATYRRLWSRDVDRTQNQIDARVAKDWSNDLASYGETVFAARTLADTITTGILAQWPHGAQVASRNPINRPTQIPLLATPTDKIPHPDPPCTSCPIGPAVPQL